MSEHEHHMHRVVLPSGKTIEVVYFEEHPSLATAPAHEMAFHDAIEMHICGACSSELVHPIRWSEAGPAHWKVTLRCPNCEWAGTGVFSQSEVERFDEQLDLGTEQLLREMQQLSAANMQSEVESFAQALAAGAILPEDF